MPNQLTTAIVRNSKYWWELLPYTYLATSLGTGNNQVFNVSSIRAASQNGKAVFLGNIAATQSANVNLTIQRGNQTRQIPTQTLPPNLGVILPQSDDGESIKSVDALGINVQNNSGAAVSNYQVNYTAGTKTLTVLEKKMLGVPLTAGEQALVKQEKLDARYMQPIPINESIKRAFLGRVTWAEPLGYQTSTTATSTTIDNKVPTNGEILVVVGIAASTTLGDQVQINLDRDGEDAYVSIYADNMSLNEYPMWMPVTEHLTIRAQSATNTTNATVQLRLKLLHIQRTELIDMLLGLLPVGAMSASQQLYYEKIQAGVIV